MLCHKYSLSGKLSLNAGSQMLEVRGSSTATSGYTPRFSNPPSQICSLHLYIMTDTLPMKTDSVDIIAPCISLNISNWTLIPIQIQNVQGWEKRENSVGPWSSNLKWIQCTCIFMIIGYFKDYFRIIWSVVKAHHPSTYSSEIVIWR